MRPSQHIVSPVVPVLQPVTPRPKHFLHLRAVVSHLEPVQQRVAASPDVVQALVVSPTQSDLQVPVAVPEVNPDVTEHLRPSQQPVSESPALVQVVAPIGLQAVHVPVVPDVIKHLEPVQQRVDAAPDVVQAATATALQPAVHVPVVCPERTLQKEPSQQPVVPVPASVQVVDPTA